MRLKFGPELRLRPELPEGEDERIINFRLSDEDFELSKEIREEDKEKFLRELEEKRLELTEEQQELVGQTDAAIATLLAEKYNIELPARVNREFEVIALGMEDYKQISDPANVNKRRFPDSAGVFIQENNTILIWYKKTAWNDNQRNQEFVHTISHEFVHAKAHSALQAYRDESGELLQTRGYRAGLQIVKLGQNEHALFHELNEAITETLGVEVANFVINNNRETFRDIILKDIDWHMKDRPTGRGYMKSKLRERMQELGYDLYTIDQMPDTEKEALRLKVRDKIFEDYEYKYPKKYQAYRTEQKALNRLVEAIARKNSEYQGMEDEIMALIYRAYFTGRMLEFGRVVEQTFGKGTFRLLAKQPSSPELQKRLK